jgi:uncharacterized integral membrane protein
MSTTPEKAAPKQPARKGQRTRVGVAAGLAALVTLFGVLNLDDVDVNWLFGTASTPLIVVIVVCIAAGMAIDRALVRRSKSARKKKQAATP